MSAVDPVPTRRETPGAWRHALLKSDLPPRALLVAHTLGTFMDKHGAAYAGIRALADGSNQSKTTVSKFLKMLVAEGYVIEDDYKLGRIQYRYATVPSVLPQDGDTPTVLPQDGDTSREGVSHFGGVGVPFQSPSVLPQDGDVTPRTPKENSNRDVEIESELCPPHRMVRVADGPEGEVCTNPSCHLSLKQRAKTKRLGLIEGIGKDIAS